MVGTVTPGGGITTYSLSTGSRPVRITTGSDGNLWVTESVGDKIARVTPGGAITVFAVPTKNAMPWGIAAGPDGNLWFTENGSSKIGRITTSGVITEFSLGQSGLCPFDIVAGSDGNLWFTEDTASILGRITTGGIITQYTLPTTGSGPEGIALGPGHTSIWWDESSAGQVGNLPWIPGYQSVTPDPSSESIPFGPGSVGPLNGNQQTGVNLDPAPPCNCPPDSAAFFDPSPTYNSDTVNVQPIIPATFASDPNGPVPTQIQVQLTWDNGTPQPWVTFATTGHKPGDVYLLSTQVANPVTTSGVYPWEVEIRATLPNGNVIDNTISGSTPVVVNGPTDPIGQGWSLSGTVQLVSDGQGGYLWVDGGGGTREFQAGNGNTFVSPPNDFGTLVRNSNGTLTYTNPQQIKWNFNSQGLLTSIVLPDGPSETFAYNSSGNLTSFTQPGGWTATFTYANGELSEIVETGDRVMTFAHDSADDLTGITYPDSSLCTFTYDDAGHQLTDSWGTETTTYTYDPTTGVLTGVNQGLGTTMGLVPESIQGLQTNPAISVNQAVAVMTDALDQLATYTLDSLGQPTRIETPDGGIQTYQYDFAGQPTVYTDAMGRVTQYTYQYGAGDGVLIQVTNPDGTAERYQYDPTFHQVTVEQDELGRLTTYTYNSVGDLTSTPTRWVE